MLNSTRQNLCLSSKRYLNSKIRENPRNPRMKDYLFMQNKPNLRRFWAKNSYLAEKQTQNKPKTNPICLQANGGKAQGSQTRRGKHPVNSLCVWHLPDDTNGLY